MSSVAIAPTHSNFYASREFTPELEFSGKSLLTGGLFLLHLLQPAPLWFRLHSTRSIQAIFPQAAHLQQNSPSLALRGLRIFLRETLAPSKQEETMQNALLESNLQGLRGFFPESAQTPPALPKINQAESTPPEMPLAIDSHRSTNLFQQIHAAQSEAKDMMTRFCRDQAMHLQKKCTVWFFGDRELSATPSETLRGWLWLAAGGTVTGALLLAAAAWLQV